MGQCYGKNRAPISYEQNNGQIHPPPSTTANGSKITQHRSSSTEINNPSVVNTPNPWASPFPHGSSPLPAGVSPSPARSTPGRNRFPLRGLRTFQLHPPSPAKHIKVSLAKRMAPSKSKEVPIPEEPGVNGKAEVERRQLDKRFGYPTNFGTRYELGKEVGRGHFGHTCMAKAKKGELKGKSVAVKIISKAKMTTPISIEDVRREVKILKSLCGHRNLIQFYDAFEDTLNVYIVMELCQGGELLNRILSRGGKYTEDDAKIIIEQILSVVSFCHLQGVVHRDLKPENFLFTTEEESAPMKLIDFGLSNFVKPDEKLNDIVGSAYYVAPEVLHRSYSTEADIWSIGVISYILLCGSRPFWARTESGIFRAVLRTDPNFDNAPWPSISEEAKDFIKRLLNKDYRKRMTAAQALTHPWLRNQHRPVPLDILIYKLIKSYLRSSPLKRATLKSLSKALSEDELIYLRAQFQLLEPNSDGCVGTENFQMALMKYRTEAMVESMVPDFLTSYGQLNNRRMDFEEFCAAAISPYQLEALKMEKWQKISSEAFRYFEKEGNRVIGIDELAKEMIIPKAASSILQDWIRPSDGKLSFNGYTKFLHGVTIRTTKNQRH
ncbi:CDPK-related kinase 3 [Zostera marina]|uniref:CDPK-related kinase 3 n=1 Tax=Zostera marina TaxID=29655 RepID=A0A0K9NNK9_ZOSMR|nr:CDPK-related kinase 3 [Zostera marina]